MINKEKSDMEVLLWRKIKQKSKKALEKENENKKDETKKLVTENK